MKTTSGEEIQYSYDGLKRLSSIWDGRKSVRYSYKNTADLGT